MNLAQVNEAMHHKITGGSEYGWHCWPDARFLDYEGDYAHVSVVFNSQTQEIYSAEINDKKNAHKPYRWMNPVFKDNYLNECEERGADPNQAWDDTYWYDLETEEDWLDKATAMFAGEEFDTRVQIPLTLSKDELHKLMEMAHERDVTLNKMVEIILEEMIERQRMEDVKR